MLCSPLLLFLNLLLVLSLDSLLNESKFLLPHCFLLLLACFFGLLLHQGLLGLLVEVLSETRKLAFQSVFCERYLNLGFHWFLYSDRLGSWRLLGWLGLTFGLSGFRPKDLFQHSLLLFRFCFLRRGFGLLGLNLEALGPDLDL